MYKVKNSKVPIYVNRIFESIAKEYSLCNADFHTPQFNTVQYGKLSLRYFGLYQ